MGVSGRGGAWWASVSANSAAGMPAVAGVWVRPGATAVTAARSLPSPTANVRAMPIKAPLDAMYASMCAPGGLQKVLDTMKITRPKPRSRIPGANACVSSSADSTLTA